MGSVVGYKMGSVVGYKIGSVVGYKMGSVVGYKMVLVREHIRWRSWALHHGPHGLVVRADPQAKAQRPTESSHSDTVSCR